MDDKKILTKVRDDAEWLAYLLALEHERNDTTHIDNARIVAEAREKLSTVQVRHIRALVDAEIEQLQSMREQRDKLFFNAGRYAAGAADEIAQASHSIMDALLDSEG
jgi:hypothetical protein